MNKKLNSSVEGENPPSAQNSFAPDTEITEQNENQFIESESESQIENDDENTDEKEEISFEDLGLSGDVLQAIEKKGFKTPSPIQVLAIPRLLNGDSNLIAKARTGTGKTAAFGLPIVQNINGESDHVRALILEPTRELAIQTCTELQSFATGKYPRVTVLYGGASYSNQIKDLKRGCEIVVGTPGRIKDHINRGTLKLDKIDYFILDEGDEMLDMGFIDDIKQIFESANPTSRILLFSATMPKPILQIAEEFLGEYEIVEEEGFVEEPLLIEQKYWCVNERDKIEALIRLIDMAPDFYGLVFTMTKNDADMVSRLLDERGYEAAALHGDIPQGQREKILSRFRSKKTRVLVATDVAARGIDISGLTHVVNYSIPFDAATYVHRIGRTGRAGTSGTAVTFVRNDERRKLEFLRKRLRSAAKGEMVEESVPSIEKVLEIKRKTLIDELKVKLGLKMNSQTQNEEKENFDSEEIVPIEIENEEKIEVQPQEFIPQLKEASSLFQKLAEELLENQEPSKVLAAVLENEFGKTLDESHYGKISAQKSFKTDPNQKRIYVQLGRRDGYNAKRIAEYFSDLLHIPGRMVDRIDVSQNFSLLSLPASNALRALELSKSRQNIPHMHFDSKEDEGYSTRRSRRTRDEDDFPKKDRFSKGDRNSFERKRSFGRNERSGFKNEHGRTRVHTATTRVGASAYKKSNRKREEY